MQKFLKKSQELKLNKMKTLLRIFKRLFLLIIGLLFLMCTPFVWIIFGTKTMNDILEKYIEIFSKN